MTARLAALAGSLVTIALIGVGLVVWRPWSRYATGAESTAASAAQTGITPGGHVGPANEDRSATTLWAHNLRLLKGPNFRVYIRWIRGAMVRTHRQVNPSLDDPDSFVLDIQKGVVHANIGDIAGYLNTNSAANAPLKNISVEPDGEQLKIHGTLHKIVPLPIELVGSVFPTPEGLVRFHVDKVAVLKLPMKSLLGGFHLKLADLVHDTKMPGITVTENDIVFDTQHLLPPPHIHGLITSLTIRPPDVEVIYGNARNDESRLAQWHNFLRLEGGSLDFGKLTMKHVDLTMVDASQDPWFNLDLVNYEAQLINGYTRITPQAGLELFMPDVDEKDLQRPHQISVEWLQNRNRSLPEDIPLKK